MFGKDYSAGVPLGLGRPNSTDCAPFSTTIERKPIPCTRQPSFSCPTRSRDIASALAREMRSVSFVSKLIEEKNILGRTMKHMLIHSIEADDVMRAMNVRSKFNADWEQVNMLMKVGCERADAWLAACNRAK